MLTTELPGRGKFHLKKEFAMVSEKGAYSILQDQNLSLKIIFINPYKSCYCEK